MTVRSPLAELRNVGPAMLADFRILGIETVAQLAECEADTLYLELQRRTGKRQDPCVHDTFRATVHEARTGEARDWWSFSAERKRRQADGEFPVGSSER